jgi:predicted RNase H-like HicB family nuclease
MKQEFSYTTWQEDDWFVAQCLDIDVASQGKSKTEAIANLKEALELHFESPVAQIVPSVEKLEVEISAA